MGRHCVYPQHGLRPIVLDCIRMPACRVSLQFMGNVGSTGDFLLLGQVKISRLKNCCQLCSLFVFGGRCLIIRAFFLCAIT